MPHVSLKCKQNCQHDYYSPLNWKTKGRIRKSIFRRYWRGNGILCYGPNYAVILYMISSFLIQTLWSKEFSSRRIIHYWEVRRKKFLDRTRMLICLLNATKMNLLVKEVTDSINCIVLTSERTNLVRLLF